MQEKPIFNPPRYCKPWEELLVNPPRSSGWPVRAQADVVARAPRIRMFGEEVSRLINGPAQRSEAFHGTAHHPDYAWRLRLAAGGSLLSGWLGVANDVRGGRAGRV